MAETLVLDPTSEDAANSPLTLTAGSYGLTEHRYPQPAIDPQWASSVSTEGSVLASQRYQNREISITVEVDCTSNLTPLRTLQAKLAKLAREGGTLQRTMSDATVIVFDILTTDGYDPSFDQTWHLGSLTTVSFTLQCKPEGRGTEQTLTLHSETTLPVNIFTETGIKGDMPARGRLVISDAQAVDQRWVAWGVQSRYYDSAATAALFYEAEGRTALGGSAIAAGPTGASGAGSNVMRNSVLSPIYVAMLSTQATGGGAHLTHVGTFRVFARVQIPTANTGTVSVALEWGAGDFRRFTRNTETVLDSAWEASWRIIDLGLVTIAKAVTGSQQWEGRVLAKSTVTNDRLDVDWLALFPADEGYGQIASTYALPSPTVFSARDEFDQTAGALTGKAAPVGGTWTVVAGSDADDFNVETTGHTAQRTAVSDASQTGRLVTVGTTSYTAIAAQVDIKRSANVDVTQMLLAARVSSFSSYVRAGYRSNDVTSTSGVWKVEICLGGGSAIPLGSYVETLPLNEFWTIRLVVAADGRYYFWRFRQGASAGNPIIQGQESQLATGGAQATGAVGLYDEHFDPAAETRTYDNFAAWVPQTDAAVFASQSLEVRHDRVIREDSTGSFWQPSSSYQGDYLRVPVAGSEGRSARFIVKGSRNDPAVGADSAIDDLSAQLFYTPRYVNVPSA